jgi:Fe-S cluster assembly protein SufD
VADLHELARARAVQLGLPTAAAEDWRYVRCATLGEGGIVPARPVTVAELRQWVDHTQRAIVLVDGTFHSLGHGDWPAGWHLDLPSAADDAALAASLASETDIAACWAIADGTCRQVLRISGHHPEPLHLVNLVTGGTSGCALRLELAPGASLDLVIRHVALGTARSCPLLAVHAGRGSNLKVSEIQTTPWHHLLGTTRIRAEADAQVTWTSVAAGGACVRFAIHAVLCGKGAHVALAGVADVHGSDQMHHLTRVTHAAGDSTSDQLFKAILHDRTQTSFDGRVAILKGCDGAQAEQQNRNLLLSDTARADTRPQLAIEADEVKAAHGATVGQLAADELLYLRLRGIPLAEARALLTRGFVGEVLARLPHPEFAP